MGFVIDTGYDRELAKASVGKGWNKLIDILYDAMPENTVVCQVKEKWGQLRFYTNGTTNEFHDLIDVMGWASECICENCGKVGQLLNRGWWKTKCPECIVKEKL